MESFVSAGGSVVRLVHSRCDSTGVRLAEDAMYEQLLLVRAGPG